MNFFMKYLMSHMALRADPGRLNGVSEVKGFPGPIFWTSTQQAVAFVCATSLVMCYRLTDGKYGYKLPPLLTWQAKGQVALLSVFFAVNIAMNNFSVSLLSLTANNMIRSCSPFTTALCATLMFGNTMCFEEWAFMCLGMIFVFVTVLAGASEQTKENEGFLLGSILCFISTFAGAGMFIIVELAGKAAVKLNAMDSTCYMSLPAAIFLLPGMFVLPHVVGGGWADGTMEGTHTDAKLVRTIDDGKLWLMMVVSGIFAAAYNALQFVLVQKLSSTQTAFASLMSKGCTVLIDCFFIKKFSNPKQFWALVLSAIGGLICFALFSRAKGQRTQEGISSGPQRRREVMNGMLFLLLMGSAGVLGGLVESVRPSQTGLPPSGASSRNMSYFAILSG
mmetsp:Transcript_8555/g.22464  ORF Transcript_8555/g.22464 Transcript_8555/m.22464 type:complete len:392 (-) Transcript_8555:185-1360(-)